MINCGIILGDGLVERMGMEGVGLRGCGGWEGRVRYYIQIVFVCVHVRADSIWVPYRLNVM